MGPFALGTPPFTGGADSVEKPLLHHSSNGGGIKILLTLMSDVLHIYSRWCKNTGIVITLVLKDLSMYHILMLQEIQLVKHMDLVQLQKKSRLGT